MSTATGTSGTRLYTIWRGIKARCQSPSHTAYAQYGARGIKVCEDWQTFVGFLNWALDSGYRNDLTVDRIDVDGHYEPANCRWLSAGLNASRTILDRKGEYLATLTGRLTEGDVAEAIAREQPYKIHDGRGLHLHVSITGARSFRFKFFFEDKERLLTLGRYPKVTLAEARELATIARARLAVSRNPARIKQQSIKRAARHRRATSTVEEG